MYRKVLISPGLVVLVVLLIITCFYNNRPSHTMIHAYRFSRERIVGKAAVDQGE